MTLDDADRNYIREELRRVEDHLTSQIKMIERELTVHQTDRFAHGWDHNLVERSAALQQEWMTWREGVNKWLWMMAGALLVISVEAPLATTLLVNMWHPR